MSLSLVTPVVLYNRRGRSSVIPNPIAYCLFNRAGRFKALSVGGAYVGLSAATRLLSLCQGRLACSTSEALSLHKALDSIPVEVTIVDERERFCTELNP